MHTKFREWSSENIIFEMLADICIKFEIIGDGKGMIWKVSCQWKEKNTNLGGEEGNQSRVYGTGTGVTTLESPRTLTKAQFEIVTLSHCLRGVSKRLHITAKRKSFELYFNYIKFKIWYFLEMGEENQSRNGKRDLGGT